MLILSFACGKISNIVGLPDLVFGSLPTFASLSGVSCMIRTRKSYLPPMGGAGGVSIEKPKTECFHGSEASSLP
jgi:hypothetical protein